MRQSHRKHSLCLIAPYCPSKAKKEKNVGHTPGTAEEMMKSMQLSEKEEKNHGVIKETCLDVKVWSFVVWVTWLPKKSKQLVSL